MGIRAASILIGLLALACNTSSAPASNGEARGTPAKIAVGQPAPKVELVLQDARRVSLASLRGKHVVLFFYPKDDTPGCRLEARSFREQAPALEAKNVVVFGVSMQGAVSHQAFIDKEELNFDLVVDDGTVAAAFEVPVRAQRSARQTVLVDPQGIIRRIWRDVSPGDHAREVLAEVGR